MDYCFISIQPAKIVLFEKICKHVALRLPKIAECPTTLRIFYLIIYILHNGSRAKLLTNLDVDCGLFLCMCNLYVTHTDTYFGGRKHDT